MSSTGEVIALYGGPDFVKNSRNWATTPRPTASTFKAYALAAGLKDGYSLFDTFNGNTWLPPGDSEPRTQRVQPPVRRLGQPDEGNDRFDQHRVRGSHYPNG